MRSFEKTLSLRRALSRMVMERLGSRLRSALSLLDETPADLLASEVMIAAARCAFGPVEIRREGSKLRYSAAPEAMAIYRQPPTGLPASAIDRRHRNHSQMAFQLPPPAG